jgi:hypothetical protein
LSCQLVSPRAATAFDSPSPRATANHYRRRSNRPNAMSGSREYSCKACVGIPPGRNARRYM